MYNYVFLVGRLVRDVEIKKTDSGVEVSSITLAVSRPFKNTETNLYDTDFIKVSVWEPVVGPVAEFAHKGDAIGVKGRIQTRREEIGGKNIYTQEVVAERIIFLSNSKTTIQD